MFATSGAEFYRLLDSMDAIDGMHHFARAVGLLSSPVLYDQVVGTRFQDLWCV
jgi:hypothetical protein